MIKHIITGAFALSLLQTATGCRESGIADRDASHHTAKYSIHTPAHQAHIQKPGFDLHLLADATYKLSDSIRIGFVVYNPTSDTLSFTTYHTPFEGFISQFLTVTDSTGREMAYTGAMARRVMPPPAETYRQMAPLQSDSVYFHLRQVYTIEKPGKYTIQYNGENISGLPNGTPVTIAVTE